jgi:carbohydrate kinase (thermoresistant glucokinase family)
MNSDTLVPIMRILVMGVSGCGKTSVGIALAEALSLPFIDGDDLHPQANRTKMAGGTPLTDEDRWPWLDKVGQALAEADAPGIVIACSALKRVYRERILAVSPDTLFVHLTGSRQLLLERMQGRGNHFMKPEMLDSQLAILEPLDADEPGVTFDVAQPLANIVAEAVTYVSDRRI